MAATDDLHLYGFWRSQAAYRVRVALALKGLQARETALDLDAGDQFKPEYLAVNPEGAVPALVVPGHPPITQSMAILEYLEEAYPSVPLLPADPHGRARVRSLAALVVSDTHPLLVPRVRSYLTGTVGLDEAGLRAWSLNWMTRGVTAIEARLANDPATGKFCHGDRVTLADVCLTSLVAPARALRFAAGFAPIVSRVVDACEALEAFAVAHPSRQLGAPKG